MDIMALVRLAGGIMFTPLSDDVLMMSFAALRLREGMYPVVIWLTVWPVFFIAFTWFYLLARFFREIPLVKRWMKSRFLERAETIIERRGLWAIGLSFFLPGVRHPIHYVAGLLGYPLPRYLVMTFLAAGVYTGLWTFLIVRIGEAVTWSELWNWLQVNPGIISAIVVILIGLVVTGIVYHRRQKESVEESSSI
ncbi:membrane protein [Exiguobacterium indicum]|uniref:Membrane protein n=1 Tax=Exiguobacterium indicum TaxID=296995 RepID=A0AAW3ME40_9BACL|nr:VTT domain-containing protein [Exiguobacterium indicum]KTR27258.1 membrane protein [Exiguobacterium indicum]